MHAKIFWHTLTTGLSENQATDRPTTSSLGDRVTEASLCSSNKAISTIICGNLVLKAIRVMTFKANQRPAVMVLSKKFEPKRWRSHTPILFPVINALLWWSKIVWRKKVAILISNKALYYRLLHATKNKFQKIVRCERTNSMHLLWTRCPWRISAASFSVLNQSAFFLVNLSSASENFEKSALKGKGGRKDAGAGNRSFHHRLSNLWRRKSLQTAQSLQIAFAGSCVQIPSSNEPDVYLRN